MGKSNLTTNSKKKGGAVKGNSGIPNWILSTIVIVVLAAVLISVGASAFANSGLVMRMSMAMESEDYKVNGNMMAYFYANTYGNFASSYSSMLSSTSLGSSSTMDIEKHKSTLITDTSDNNYDSLITSSAYVGKTWFDFFMDQTKSGVKSILLYCEEADERGIELTKEEKDEIKTALDSLILQFKLTNGAYTDKTCLKAMYGAGVSKNDVIKAMELASLAEKCSGVIYDEIEAAVNDGRIDAEYLANSNDYNVVDYFYYSFKVNYSDVAKEYLESKNLKNTNENIEANKSEILAVYKEKIAEAKKNADELEKITDLGKFKEHVYNFVANRDYQDLYDKVVDTLKTDKKLTTDQIPTVENLAVIKEKMIAAAVAQVVAGDKEYKDDVVKTGDGDSATYTLYDIAITKEFANAADSVKEDVFDAVLAAKETYTVEKAEYADSDFGKWAFEGAKENEVKGMETGDSAKDEAIPEKPSSFDGRVYFITKPERRDEDKAKDLAYMLFTENNDAFAAIEKLKTITPLTKEQFETVAKDSKASAQTVYEDYIKGALSEANLDTWLFDDERKAGDFSLNPIVMSDNSQMVAYYVEDGEYVWKVKVKAKLISDDMTAAQEALGGKHGAKIGESSWTLSRIGG